MPDNTAVDIAIAFIEKINRRDFEGLRRLMADGFVGIDEDGHETAGRAAAAKVIEQYATDHPDFQIHIADVYASARAVSIVARTTGSCASAPRAAEIRRTRLYQIEVDDALAKSFRYAVPDSPAERARLGIVPAARVTE